MEETIILDLKIDQGAAQKQLEQTEANLIDLKKAQQDLRLEYNKGNITQAQYVKENLKLQNSIKKETDQKRTLIKTVETESNSRNALRLQISRLTKEYDNLNRETAEGVKRADELEKELAQLSSQLTKGDKAANLFKNQIGNYPEAFQNAASSIRVAGVSVGDITSKLASFANPATAAVGIVTALGGAYLRSTIGAKDLEFAQNQLTSSITLATNAFAEFISSGQDGEGVLSQLTNRFIAFFSAGAAAVSKLQAESIELLEDLGREEISIRGDISDRLEENQELLTLISDEQTSINEKIEATNAIEANLINNRDTLVDILQKQLKELETQLSFDRENEEIQTRIVQLEREISKEKAQTTKRIEANNRLQDDLNAKLQKQLELERGAARRSITSDDAAILSGKGQTVKDASGNASTLGFDVIASENAEDFQQGHADRMLKINQDYYAQDVRFKKHAQELKDDIDRQALKNSAQIAGQAADLFKEGSTAFQVLASGQALINTYAAATAALAPPPLGAGPIFGPAFAAVAIATGLANVAKINGIQFADGGYTGPGHKYQPAGIVHAGEVVWNQEDVARVGGPAAANAMRPTASLKPYADGGFVTNRNIESSQQALIMANAFKNLPPAQVSVVEVTKVQNKISAREKIARL